MKLVATALALFLVGCISQPVNPNQYRISLSIRNDSWEASRARVYCGDGTRITNINGLGFVQTTRRTISVPPHCESIRLLVMGHGLQRWSNSRMVIDGEGVCARINSLMQTEWQIGCYT